MLKRFKKILPENISSPFKTHAVVAKIFYS